MPLVCPSLPATLPRPLPTLRVYLFSAPLGRPSHSSPWEKASWGGFQSHSKAKAGQARPHPRSQLPLVSGRWVGGWDGGAVEDPEHWPREPGVNTDKSLELPSLPLSLSPYFTGKDPECCPRPTSLGLGFSPAACPPFSWPPPVSIFLEHLLCPLPHFLLSPSCASLPLPLLPSSSSSTL